MRKTLIVLFIIPVFIYGQDVPLTEKKVTTEAMENKERKLKEKEEKLYLLKDFNEGKKDAKNHYKCKNCGKNVTGVLSAISPVYGIIAAPIYSLSPPKEHNLNYPSSEKMRNNNYNLGYKKQADKMKSRRIWASFAIGSAINIAVIIIAVSANN